MLALQDLVATQKDAKIGCSQIEAEMLEVDWDAKVLVMHDMGNAARVRHTTKHPGTTFCLCQNPKPGILLDC